MLDQPQPDQDGKGSGVVWTAELVLAYREELSDQLSKVYCVAHMSPVRISEAPGIQNTRLGETCTMARGWRQRRKTGVGVAVKAASGIEYQRGRNGPSVRWRIKYSSEQGRRAEERTGGVVAVEGRGFKKRERLPDLLRREGGRERGIARSRSQNHSS